MDPLATYTGSLQCWNWSDIREAGGVPAGRLVIWPDRLEMAGRNALKAVFRPRTIPKERVQLIRPLLSANLMHQVISAVHPLARGRQYINVVVRPPEAQADNTGNIHYLLGIRCPDTAEPLNVLEDAGFPVSRTAIRTTQLNIGGELSWRDFSERLGR